MTAPVGRSVLPPEHLSSDEERDIQSSISGSPASQSSLETYNSPKARKKEEMQNLIQTQTRTPPGMRHQEHIESFREKQGSPKGQHITKETQQGKMRVTTTVVQPEEEISTRTRRIATHPDGRQEVLKDEATSVTVAGKPKISQQVEEIQAAVRQDKDVAVQNKIEEGQAVDTFTYGANDVPPVLNAKPKAPSRAERAKQAISEKYQQVENKFRRAVSDEEEYFSDELRQRGPVRLEESITYESEEDFADHGGTVPAGTAYRPLKKKHNFRAEARKSFDQLKEKVHVGKKGRFYSKVLGGIAGGLAVTGSVVYVALFHKNIKSHFQVAGSKMKSGFHRAFNWVRHLFRR